MKMKNANTAKKYIQKKENKISNIKIFKSVNVNINNNINDNNIYDNLNIIKQEKQTRNKSIKAKKFPENKNKKIGKEINTNTNLYSNKDYENLDKVELLLKAKIHSINPDVNNKKNFLKASINEYDLFNYNDIVKENNDIFIGKKDLDYLNNELMPKTNIIKNPNKNNIINIITKKDIKDKNNNIYSLNKKNFAGASSLRGSNIFNQNQNKEEINNIGDLNILKKKEVNENIINNKKQLIKDRNILIPMTNYTKENNCFLNSLIQVLSNLDEFRDYLLDKIFKFAQNDVVKELCELINSYKNFQEKYRYCENKEIEPILSVNILRKYLNNLYGNYQKGECGDPMETLEHLLDLIHEDYLLINNTKEEVVICNCPSHKYFFLDLSEIKYCTKCYKLESKSYDKNCYIFNVFVSELLNKIKEKNQNYNAYKLNLFPKIKEHSEIYENPNRIKLAKCKCSSDTELVYAKKIRLSNSNPYLIINLTWAEEFPNMIDILNVFSLIPMVDKYRHLFSIDKKEKNINIIFYIKAIILYGIYHYVCIIYMNKEKRWGIIDDKTIKYIDKNYDLIDHLLKNHLLPVGLFYSQKIEDKIEENELKSNVLTNEEYLKLYKFCEDVEKRRELKISNIAKIKGSFNETNEDYLNNNLFYKSILSILNSSSDSDYEECKKKIDKIDNNIISKNNLQLLNSSSGQNNEEYQKKKDNIKIDKNNDININEENNKNEINYGSHCIGDFNDNNIKGGIIVLTTEDNAKYEEHQKYI